MREFMYATFSLLVGMFGAISFFVLTRQLLVYEIRLLTFLHGGSQ